MKEFKKSEKDVMSYEDCCRESMLDLKVILDSIQHPLEKDTRVWLTKIYCRLKITLKNETGRYLRKEENNGQSNEGNS